MRVAVLSDVHGNDVAFAAALADLAAHPADAVVCLGDMVQGGPQPAETVARLRALGCPVVLGNADAYLLSGDESGPEAVTDRLRRQRAWSLAHLSEADRAFIAAFQPVVDLPLEGGRTLRCFHGSPISYDDVILPTTPDDVVRGFLGSAPGVITTGGHTHRQQIRPTGADGFFFNPGSVGFSFHHGQEPSLHANPWAEYAVLTSEGERIAVEFRRVPFDVDALRHIVRASGIPDADDYTARYGD